MIVRLLVVGFAFLPVIGVAGEPVKTLPEAVRMLGLEASDEGFTLVLEEPVAEGSRVSRRSVTSAGVGAVVSEVVVPRSLGPDSRRVVRDRWYDVGSTDEGWLVRTGLVTAPAVQTGQLGALLQNGIGISFAAAGQGGLFAWWDVEEQSEHQAGPNPGDARWVLTARRARPRAALWDGKRLQQVTLSSSWRDSSEGGPPTALAVASGEHRVVVFSSPGDGARQVEAVWLGAKGQVLRLGQQQLPARQGVLQGALSPDGALHLFASATGFPTAQVAVFSFDAKAKPLAPQLTTVPPLQGESSTVTCEGQPWLLFTTRGAPPDGLEMRALARRADGTEPAVKVLGALTVPGLDETHDLFSGQLTHVAACQGPRAAFVTLRRARTGARESTLQFFEWRQE